MPVVMTLMREVTNETVKAKTGVVIVVAKRTEDERTMMTGAGIIEETRRMTMTDVRSIAIDSVVNEPWLEGSHFV